MSKFMEQFDQETSELLTEFTARHNQIDAIAQRLETYSAFETKSQRLLKSRMYDLEIINELILIELQSRGHMLDPNE